MALPVLKNNSPGADSIEVSVLPTGLDWYAGYVGGAWPDYSAIYARFGKKAWVKSIAVSAVEDADILDIESGDAVVSQAFGWWQRQRARGLKLPGFYTSASNLPALLSALGAAGLQPSEYVIWVADWDGVAVVPPNCAAKQYTDRGPRGENYDRNVCNPSFFGQFVKPVVNKIDYNRFQRGPFSSKWGDLDERSVVLHYDGARQHPIRYFLFLRTLRAQLQFLADRVAYESLYDPKTGKKRAVPDWATALRGWRFQQLIHRAQNQRFV